MEKKQQYPVDDWGKYVAVVPEAVVNRLFMSERSVMIYRVQQILLKAYRTNKNGERHGLGIPFEEFFKFAPKKHSISYIQTKLRELGLVVRIRQELDKKMVWMYIDGYARKFQRLQKLKGKSNGKAK